MKIPRCDLDSPKSVLRNQGWGQAYRLTENGPAFDGSPESLISIIKWLGVESGARWKPTPSSTYCNVYATDFCHACGVYLPRVWWSKEAEADLQSGKEVKAVYGKTAFELSANALYRWLDGPISSSMGWTRTSSVTEAQRSANSGSPVVICARKKIDSSPGHVSVLAPECGGLTAERIGDEVKRPVQSQAGAKNEELGLAGGWWEMKDMAEWGIWVHDSTFV